MSPQSQGSIYIYGLFNAYDLESEKNGILTSRYYYESVNYIDNLDAKQEDEFKKTQKKQEWYLINYLYSISQTEWKELRNMDADKRNKACYALFLKRWSHSYEQWLRQMVCILQYLVDYAPRKTDGNQNLYFDIFRAQLTQREGDFIRLHAKVDEKLSDILKKAKQIQKN